MRESVKLMLKMTTTDAVYDHIFTLNTQRRAAALTYQHARTYEEEEGIKQAA
jgi:hypothetical protein